MAGATPLWHFTFKNHAMAHIGIDCSNMSPRLCWTYKNESFMGIVRQLIKGSSTMPGYAILAAALR
eukprot:4770222-Amphidinium_carterae.1